MPGYSPHQMPRFVTAPALAALLALLCAARASAADSSMDYGMVVSGRVRTREARRSQSHGGSLQPWAGSGVGPMLSFAA